MLMRLLLVCFLAFAPAFGATETTPPPRAHHAMIFSPAAGEVLLTGGSTPRDGGRSFQFFNDVWTFDGRRWAARAEAGDRRSGQRLVFDSDRREILSFGGYRDGASLGDLRVWRDGAWLTLTDRPDMIAAEAGAAYDAARRRLVVLGGSRARGLLNDATWEWDGADWTKFAGAGPTPRQAFAMVYDSVRRKIVVFGGMGATPQEVFGDTWEFDGSSWRQVSTTGPAPRFVPGYAFDEKRGLLVIFGGLSANGSLGDTWAWNGSEWKQLADTGPSPRGMGYLAYDPKRDRIVLFGGRLNWPNDVGDTWEWDGALWTEVRPATPVP
jgi:hypothetical protein